MVTAKNNFLHVEEEEEEEEEERGDWNEMFSLWWSFEKEEGTIIT